jgi:SRSO17 transposase
MLASNRHVNTGAGRQRVDQIAAGTPRAAWQTYSAGAGSKGPRNYDWAWHQLLPEQDSQGHHWLLIRRNTKTGELAYLLCYSPRRVPLAALIRVAGQRWRIEENFQAAKGLTGLDQHQVRRWTSWHRWSVLAMLAHAFLAVATVIERTHAPTPQGMIELTVNEFRKLFDALVLTGKPTADRRIRWSHWRRRHQARARDCHYRTRLEHQ